MKKKDIKKGTRLKNKHRELIVESIGETGIAFMSDYVEHEISFNGLRKLGFEVVVEFYHKQPVYAWDNNETHQRRIRFYNSKNNRPYAYNGEKSGISYDNYEAIPEHLIPEWMKEAQKTLED